MKVYKAGCGIFKFISSKVSVENLRDEYCGSMRSVRFGGILAIWACALACALVSAQITFSRDWTGGKRSPHLPLDCSQFTRLCRHFVHELKQTLATEMGGKHQREDLDKPVLYDDE